MCSDSFFKYLALTSPLTLGSMWGIYRWMSSCHYIKHDYKKKVSFPLKYIFCFIWPEIIGTCTESWLNIVIHTQYLWVRANHVLNHSGNPPPPTAHIEQYVSFGWALGPWNLHHPTELCGVFHLNHKKTAPHCLLLPWCLAGMWMGHLKSI